MAKKNSDSGKADSPRGREQFRTTHWSVILNAKDGSDEKSRSALEELCQLYWHPLYLFVLRQRYSEHDAQDLTQSFFTRLIEKGYLEKVSQRKGRFRTFLLVALKHFLSNERNFQNAQKRGGGKTVISINKFDAEDGGGFEPFSSMTPEKAFEKKWALTLLNKVLDRLNKEYITAGKEPFFEEVKSSLSGEETKPYSEIAETLGMSEGAVKTAVHRMKQRYSIILRDEVGQTVEKEGDIESEIQHLIMALRER